MRPYLLLPLTFILLDAPEALATVYLPADFAEMVTTSSFILHASVVDVRSEPTADRRTIATYVTVEVLEPLKGRPGESITFRVPGGQVGRYQRIVVGAPEFGRGDEVVLFLASRGPSVPYVFGLSQGVYRISRAAGRAVVSPPALFMHAGGVAGPIVRGDPARRPLPLEQFASEVRAVMAGAR